MDPWEAEGTDTDYYVPYTSLNRIENSVIDFDVDNIEEVLYPKHKEEAHDVAKRVNKHYLNCLYHEKRAFGNKRVDDFQIYNWGLTLAVDMGLIADQTELLMSFYANTMDDRLTEKEVETIIILHTNFKSIPNKLTQQRKWRDLKKSWKLLAVKIDGYPPTISKKDFMRSLDVNFIDFDVNVDRLSRDMQNVDYDAAYLHMLLLDDPVIRGEFPPPKKDFCSYPKSRRKIRQHKPRGGDDDDSFALFQEMMEKEQEVSNTAEDREVTVQLQEKLEKKKLDDDDAKQRKLDRQSLIASETARRDLQEIADDELAQRVNAIKEERRKERQLQRKRDRQALVKATSQPLSNFRREPSPSEISVSLLAPDVSKATNLKPPPLAYRPPSPPPIKSKPKIPPSHYDRDVEKQSIASTDDVEPRKPRPLDDSLDDIKSGEESVEKDMEDNVDIKKVTEQAQVHDSIQQEPDDFEYVPDMDDDEYFIGEMADASILALFHDLDFLDKFIKETIEPPPPSAEEIAEWKRQAAARKKEALRIRKELAYIEGLCDEAIDLCIDRIGEDEVGTNLEDWRREDECTDNATAIVFDNITDDMIGSASVDMHKEKQRHDMAETVTEGIFENSYHALLESKIAAASKFALTDELVEEAFEKFFEPFIENVVSDRMDLSIQAKLDVDYTKYIMEKKATEAEMRKQELQRQKEEAEQRKKEAAERKARQLAAKKEEEARIKAEKKQKHLEMLEQMEKRRQEKKGAALEGSIVEFKVESSNVADDVPLTEDISTDNIHDEPTVQEQLIDDDEIRNDEEDFKNVQKEEEAQLDIDDHVETPKQEQIFDEEEVEEHVVDQFKTPAEMADHIERLMDSVKGDESIEDDDDEEAYDELFEIAYDIVSDGVIHDLLQETVNAEARGEEVTPLPSGREELPAHEQENYDLEYEDDVIDMAVDVVEDTMTEILFEESVIVSSKNITSGNEDKDVEDAVKALLSDKLHLDLQKLMSESGSHPAFQEPPLTPVLYECTDDVSQPSCFPSLEELHSLLFQDYRFNVPKTNGQLRIHIRHDDEGDCSGLFVHGFKSYSRAEEQGLLQIGDEILELNGEPMENKGLIDVIDALEGHFEEFVTMVVRRHEAEGGLMNGTISPRFSVSVGLQSSTLMSDLGGSVVSAHSSSTMARGIPDTSPRPYIVAQTQQPETFPPLEDLLKLPSKVMGFIVPKTNGQLRIELRHDDDGETNGIFIQGFRPFSEAKKQGLLKVGDELLEIEGVDVCGKTLEDVINVLGNHYGDDVEIVVCRREKLEELENIESHFAEPGSSRRGSNMGVTTPRLPNVDPNQDLEWEDIALDSDSTVTEPQKLFVGESGFSVSSMGSRSHNHLDIEDNGSLAASTHGIPDGDAHYTTELQSNASHSETSPRSEIMYKDNQFGDKSKNVESGKYNEQTTSTQDIKELKNEKAATSKEHTSGKDQNPEKNLDDLHEDMTEKIPPQGLQKYFSKKRSMNETSIEGNEKVKLQRSTSDLKNKPKISPRSIEISTDNQGVKSARVEFSPVASERDKSTRDHSDPETSTRTTKPDISLKEAARRTRDKIRIVKLSNALLNNENNKAPMPLGGNVTSSAPSTARTSKSVLPPDMRTYTEEIEVDAPRTGDQLRIMIKRFNKSETSERGFYIHGFQPMCRAEGVLLAGDVILEIDGKSVEQSSLKGVARIIGGALGPSVKFKVKRSFTVQK